MKWSHSDVVCFGSDDWPKVRWMTGADSLEEAEGRVAFDVVLLLEAVKLSRVNVHSRQHLHKETNTEIQQGCCRAEGEESK